MGRFWNLQTKLIGVLVLVLTGSFLLQTVIHEHNEQQLLMELEKVTLDIANETSDLITGALQRQGGAQPLTLRFVMITQGAPRTVFTGRSRPPAGRQPSSVELSEEYRLELDPEEQKKLAMRVLQFQRAQPTLQEILAQLIHAFGEDSPYVFEDSSGVPPLREDESSIRGASSRGSSAGDPSVLDGELLAPSPLLASVSSSVGPLAVERDPTLDVTRHIDRVQRLFNDSKRHDLIATVGVFLIGIALAWFLGVRVTRPVDDVIHGFQRLADGDFESRVTERPGEEFGHLGRQFNTMVDRLREGRHLEQELSQRERIQHMGDLAAGVAHDVRNPLNAIHLNIGQIRDEFVPEGGRSRERFLRFTADVQREVERLNLLVTNFLSLAQPASASSESVAPNELVDELFRLLRKEAIGQHVELVLDLAEDLPTVQWNRQEMKSAFLNIAINALQVLRHDGGHLMVATAQRAGRDGPELVVNFADDGPGIPPEDLERVFVPYYTTREGGTGLGMAIARRTAERHGGRVELHSTFGEGTSVSFVFPVGNEGWSEGEGRA